MEVLIEHGHKKEDILYKYTRDEVELFFEQCIRSDMRRNADVIEFTAVAIGAAFGGGKKVENVIKQLRD